MTALRLQAIDLRPTVTTDHKSITCPFQSLALQLRQTPRPLPLSTSTPNYAHLGGQKAEKQDLELASLPLGRGVA